MSLQLTSEAAAKYPRYVRGSEDFLFWAKRINYRAERGDKTLMPIQISTARDALAGIYPKQPR